MGNRKRGKVAWSHGIQSHPKVVKWENLCKFGRGIHCHICPSFIKMRRYFDSSNWACIGGHIHVQKHEEKRQARQWTERQEEIDWLKNLEDGTVLLPPKLKAQASLASLFSKQRASGSGTSRAKSTSTGSKARPPTPVSKLCEGIIPRKLGSGKKLSLMNTYCQIGSTSKYHMQEYGDCLYKGLQGRGCNPYSRNVPWHTMWWMSVHVDKEKYKIEGHSESAWSDFIDGGEISQRPCSIRRWQRSNAELHS